MSGIKTVPSAIEADAVEGSATHPMRDASDALLDASSLQTVLTMLEVIDSIEELSLLETLSLAQKRQVWEATPEVTRLRLKQLRMQGATEDREPSDSSHAPDLTHTATLIDATDLLQTEESAIEETAAVDLQVQQDEIDLMLQEPLNLAAVPTVAVGDWIVLQAKPKLTRSELVAIWEVVEVQGNYARILANGPGMRIYPTHWMMLYPKPIDYVEPEF